MKKFGLLLPLLLCVPFSAAETGTPVNVAKVPSATNLKTACKTDHQGEHLITEARAVIKDGTLYIHFPMNPAYHLMTDITVKNGIFNTSVKWQPIYSSIPVTLTVTREHLILDKMHFAPGDIVNGFLDLAFTVTGDQRDVPDGKRAYYVKGPFSVIVRPGEFDPVADNNIQTYDLDTALYELGLPRHAFELSFIGYSDTVRKRLESPPFEYTGNMWPPGQSAITDEFIRLHSQSTGSVIREITWDINPHRPFSDGPERLTIWFGQTGNTWRQLGYRKWEADR